METRDWSLVFFTVLTQAAVGAFLVLQVMRYLTARSGAREGAAAVPLAVVLGVLAAGLSAALFHLSAPLQAARAVLNFSSSWLSREIVFGSLFAALLGVMAARERHADARLEAQIAARNAELATRDPAPAGPAGPGPTAGRPALAAPAITTTWWLPLLTAAAGLAFIGCQIAIYLLPAQPAWNSLATPAAFGGTALRLGILGVAAGLAVRSFAPDDRARPGGAWRPGALRGLALTGAAALALEFVVVPLHLATLAADSLPAAAASAERLTDDYGGVLLLRLGLLGAAVTVLGGVLAIVRGPARPARYRFACALACGAFGLVLASEVCGRFLFYAMRVRVGI